MTDLNLIIAFIAAVVVLMTVDLVVVGKKSHTITTKEAGIWTVIFVMVSLLFAAYVWHDQGKVKATEFLSAYVIEKTLSVDNLFVFILIFGYFKVPNIYHHKVLFWGIFGAFVLRAIFIFSGVSVMRYLYVTVAGYHINILLILFGAFLVYAGIKGAIKAMNDIPDEEEQNFEDSPGAKLIRKIFKNRVARTYDGGKFVTKQIVQQPSIVPGISLRFSPIPTKVMRFATPLLVVVGVVEFTDLLFAVDSIPAIFSVSKDPFILYSSNIFAILGLRSMYFLLANLLPLFTYLNHGLAVILAFIGTKMVISPFCHINSNLSLFIVLGILLLSVVISLLLRKSPKN